MEGSEPSDEGSSHTSTSMMTLTAENVNNENREIELRKEEESANQEESSSSVSNPPPQPVDSGDQFKDYAEHVTYDGNNDAIYTDPATKCEYKWDKVKNEWTLRTNSESDSNLAGAQTNPLENEHYRWCSEKNEWVLKENVENEHYRWCAETKQWIPKANEAAEVKYSSEDGQHTYTDKDGMVFFWDSEKNAWFPKIDDDFMAMYQMNYGFIDNTTVNPAKTDNTIQSTSSSAEPKKAEEMTAEGASNEPNKLKRKAEPPKWFDLPPEQNTKVYVSNLPLDITEEEFVGLMSKCGLIMRDIHTQKLKVKLYLEPDGSIKGDGLCNYIKIESVDLALKILDGYDVRGKKIKVQRAQFQMRGDYDPSLKPKKKKKDKEKEKKMKEKLFDWRPDKMRGERGKNERVVIIKNLFTPELFDEKVHLILDYQNDLREKCSECGAVKKVVIYDRHPEGVAQVTMADAEEADLLIKLLNNATFCQRKLTAETWDGKTKYKIGETEEEVNKRLDQWQKHLEEEEEKKEKLDSETKTKSDE